MDISKAPIAMMEPAIVERLRLAFPANKFQIQRVPSVLTLKEFDRTLKLLPFIGLAWMSMATDPNAGRQLTGVASWRLVLIVKATNNLETRFKGDRYDIGLDAMIDVATILLHGVTLGEIGPCAVKRAEAIYAEGHADDATVLAQVDFEIRYAAPLSGLQLKTVDDFKKLGVTWLTDPKPEFKVESEIDA